MPSRFGPPTPETRLLVLTTITTGQMATSDTSGKARTLWPSTTRRFASRCRIGNPSSGSEASLPGCISRTIPCGRLTKSREKQFVIAVEAGMRDNWPEEGDLRTHPADSALRREYATAIVQRRVHQRVFRERVLTAYARRCALCNLRHTELLDAAHIKEDSEGGEPVVPNGVAMCALHHRAFDNNVIGIRPDYVVETNRSVLLERDGPTLRHGLQGVHEQALILPRQRDAQPDRHLLEERYERFRAAS